MAKITFNTGKITGIVTVVPANKKSIDEEVHLYGGDIKKIQRIKKTIGIDCRHVVDNNTTSADMCYEAAEILIKNMNINKETIDCLIFVTQTPDYFQPCNACYLHGIMGLTEDCPCFDINLGCSGYIYGLWLAFMMIESKSCKKVLLLAGDTISRCVNPKDRATAPLFGDAGTATLIEEGNSKSYFTLHTDGKGFNNLIIPAGAFRHPHSENTVKEEEDEEGNIKSKENLHMNGAEIFNFSIKVEPKEIKDILAFSGKNIDEIDYIVFHQANKYIISNIVRRTGFPIEKAPSDTVEKYGNQSSASIPGAICNSLGEKVSKEKKTVIMSGFGVGLSWGSCLTDLDKIYCSHMITYKGEYKK